MSVNDKGARPDQGVSAQRNVCEPVAIDVAETSDRGSCLAVAAPLDLESPDAESGEINAAGVLLAEHDERATRRNPFLERVPGRVADDDVAQPVPVDVTGRSDRVSHSLAGSEPHVMPAPVPKCSVPPASQNVRMPTASRARRWSASTQPIAPQ